MRLLIVTQAVDTRDPILGFFHGWLGMFAQQLSHVTVVGQRVGEHALPANVEVVSLKKEDGLPVWRQVLRFWKLQWSLRKKYDAVLVHMTPVWVVIGALSWLLQKKPIYLWYESRGTKWLKRALLFVTKTFSASPYGMPIDTPKSVIVGHGIDTTVCSPGKRERNTKTFVAVGRITRNKHVDVLLNAFLSLPDNYILNLIGEPITEDDEEYHQELMQIVEEENADDRVLIQSLPHSELITLLQRATAFIHASETGLDKAVLEAMACGCPVISSGEAFQSILPSRCRSDRINMAPALKAMLAQGQAERMKIGEQLRQIVVQDHSLQRLIGKLVKEMFDS